MASEYKGLTIVFNGEAGPLNRALSSIIQNSRKASSQVRSISRALDFDPKSMDLLKERAKSAGDAFKAAQDKVDALKAALSSTDDPAVVSRLNRELAVAEAYLKRAGEELIRFHNESTALGRLGTSMEEAGQKAQELATKVKSIGTNLMGVGGALTAGLTVPITTGAAFAVKAAVDIDSAWYGVRKTVDATEEDYQRLKDSAIELSKTQPISAETILNIEELGGQLGIVDESTTDLVGTLEDFAMVAGGLDIATNLNAEEAATKLAQFKNITKMSNDELSNFASALVDLGNHSATTEADILEMATRIASAGESAHMSEADILGLATALSSTGMNAEAGGSAIATVIKNIATACDNYEQALDGTMHGTKAQMDKVKWMMEGLAEVTGTTVDEFRQAWAEDATGALTDFLTKANEMGDAGESLNTLFTDLGISEIRQSDAMRRLAGNSDLVRECVERSNTAWAENTALTDEVGARNESLASKFEVLKNRLTAVAEDVGRPIADALLDAADAAEPLFKTVERAAEAFSSLERPQQEMIVKWVAMAAAAGPLLTALGGMTSGVGSAVDLVGRFTGVIGGGVKGLQSLATAATTTDANLARAYATSGTFAEKLALLANPLNRASDGVAGVGESASKAAPSVDAVAQSSSAATEAVAGLAAEASKTSAEISGVADSGGKLPAVAGDADDLRNKMDGVSDSASKASGSVRSIGDGSKLRSVSDDMESLRNGAYGLVGDIDRASGSIGEISDSADGVEKASAAMGDMAASAGKVESKSKKASKAVGKVADSAKGVEEVSAAAASAASSVGGIGDEAKGSGSKLVSFGGLAKGVLKSIGSAAAGIGIGVLVTAGISLAVGAISELVAKEREAREYADLMERSHRSLADAVDGATRSVGEESAAIEGLTSGSGAVREQIKGVAEDQERLGEAIKESNAEVQVQNSKLYDAWSAIEQYANKSGMSADEQLRFKDAIELVNEACGTNYEVVDAANGKFRDGAGAVQENTDAIKRNIEQRLKLNKIEAMQDNLAEISKNKADAVAALAAAESNLTTVKEEQAAKVEAAQKAYDEAVEKYGVSSQQAIDKQAVLSETQRKANDAVAEAEGLVGDASDKVAQYAQAAQVAERNLKAFSQASEGMMDGVAGMAMASEDLLSACNQMGVPLDEVAGKIGALGISEEQFARLTPDVMAEIAASYDGTFGSVSKVLEEHGVKLDDTHRKTVEAADAIAERMGELGPQLEGVFTANNLDLDEFSLKLAEAGGSVEDFADLGAADIVALAEAFNGNVDSMVWALMHYNSVPVEDKDGNVSVNDAELVDAQGRIWVWNGTSFEPKGTEAEVEAGELVDAQNRVWVWNGTNFELKDTEAKVDCLELKDAQGRVWVWNGTKFEPKSTTAKVSGNAVDGSAQRDLEGVKRSVDNLYDRDIYVRVHYTALTAKQEVGDAVVHASGGIVSLHASGGIVDNPGAGVYIGSDAAGVAHIAGEAGAEAIVPLTNRRYAMPFVKMIANQLTSVIDPAVEVKAPPVVTNNFNTRVVRSGSDLDSAMQVINRAAMSASMEVFR